MPVVVKLYKLDVGNEKDGEFRHMRKKGKMSMKRYLIIGLLVGTFIMFAACSKELPENVNAENELSVEIEDGTAKATSEADKAVETKNTANGTESITETEQAVTLSDMEKLMQIPWEEVKKSPVYDYSGEWNSSVYKLAELPEPDISMFGYADSDGFASGVAIAHKEQVSYFDWLYTSVHGAMPNLYWDEVTKQLQVCLHPSSGTGYSVDELHVLKEDASMRLEDFCFGVNEYASILTNRVEYTVMEEKGKQLIQFMDAEEEKELAVIDVTQYLLGNDGEAVGIKNVFIADMVSFTLGEEIKIAFIPGFLPEGGYVLFDDMPVFQAPVTFEANGKFTIGEILVVQ